MERGADAHSSILSGADVFGGLTVGQAVHPQGFASHLRPGDMLGDLAEALACSGRTSVGVTAEDGGVAGMVTVNDIMRAYFEGVPHTRRLSEWLRCAGARAPPRLLRRLVVRPSALLSEVAEKMVANVVRGDCACHHILVQEADGHLHGVVSSHDLVRALCRHDMWGHHPLFGDMFAAPDAEEEITTMLVRDVMKHRDLVFTCKPTDTLRTALKTLLVTQQNSLLVVSEVGGIFGFITPRDLIKAFADAKSLDILVSDWLLIRPSDFEHRTISSDARVMDAAADMTKFEVDHLVVLSPGGAEAVGVLSSLDVVLHTKARAPLLHAPAWSGPSIGEILSTQKAKTALCSRHSALGEVCRQLVAGGQTSIIMEVCKNSATFGLLTENDIVRAFINGHGRDSKIQDWMDSAEFHHVIVPQYLQVPPTMHLTDAGAMMLTCIEPGRSCHHLVVRAVTGGWLGVFSALDMARALNALPSKLDVAKTGVDTLTVQAIMKPLEGVPSCRPGECIRDALGALDVFGQNAVVAMEGERVLGLITPRCALHALAGGVSPDMKVSDWVRTKETFEVLREVPTTSSVKDAISTMCAHCLHHLLVVERPGGRPVGILSALDVVRGVVSLHEHCPFLSLGWLRHLGVLTSFSLQAPAESLPKHKHAAPVEGPPPAKARRIEELGA